MNTNEYVMVILHYILEPVFLGDVVFNICSFNHDHHWTAHRHLTNIKSFD